MEDVRFEDDYEVKLLRKKKMNLRYVSMKDRKVNLFYCFYI